jgi:hypothetical protein
MTQVTVETYSVFGANTPEYSSLIIKNTGVNMITGKTVFNIMKHNTLRFDDIINRDLISEGEYNICKYLKWT